MRKYNHINKNLTLSLLSVILGMSICYLFRQVRMFSYISLLLFVGFGYLIYRVRPYFYIKYLAFVFNAVAGIVGVCAIEFSNIYLVELRTDSAFIGSIPLFVLSYSLFLVILLVADDSHRKTERKVIERTKVSEKSYPRYMKYMTYVTLLIYLFFWVRVIRYPAFLLNVNRFVYARLYAPQLTGIWSVLSSMLSVLLIFPLVSMMYGDKVIGISTVAIYCLYCLWIGNKFGSFFTLICLFLIILYSNIESIRTLRVRKYARIGIVALIAIVAFSFMIQSTLGDNANNFFAYRVSGQGQLWWGINKYYSGETHVNEIDDEINGLFHGSESVAENVGANYGIYKVMYLCAPKSVIDSKLSGGSRYAESGFAAAYYYLGSLGCFLHAVVMGLIISWTLNDLIKSVKNERYFRAMLLIRLYASAQTAFSMFLFHNYVDIVSLISYFILFATYRKGFVFHLWKKEKIKM